MNKLSALKPSKSLLVLVWVCLLGFAIAATAQTNNTSNPATVGRRLALVIGNDAYQYVSKLEKAGNDASAMKRELEAAGFQVELRKDVNSKNLLRSIEAFTNRINGGDQVVVFYAGHGVQIKSGNYLLPIDIEVGSESELEKTAYSLDDLTAKISEAKASFSLVMVDACRDNPLKVSGRSIGANRGLSAVEPPKGQMVVFSASRGQQALDKLSDNDNNPNGVFTREFIARMKKPNVKIEDLMREVQDSVETLAKSVHHDQRPALYNESRGNFYFYGSGSPQVTITTPAGNDPESETWNAANSINTIAAYKGYLKAYPTGRYTAAANIKLEALQQTSTNTTNTINNPNNTNKPVTSPINTPVNNPSQTAATDPDTALWNAVEKGGTEEDYDVYIKQNPKGKYTALAKQRKQKLKDEAQKASQAQEQNAWEQAQSIATIEGYNSYLSSYSKGKYAALALARIDKLKKDQAEQEKQQAAIAQLEAQRLQREQQQAAIRREDELWVNAKDAQDSQTVNSYLSSYPQGRYVVVAKLRLEQIKRDEAEAQRQMAIRQEDEAWNKAKDAQDSATVQTYLNNYPTGRYISVAQAKLDEVKKKEAELRPGKVFKDCQDCPEMVVLPAGSFMMGDVGIATPVHSVAISSIAMGRTEVTQGQWKSVMGSNPSFFSNCGDNCPVEKVSWNDVQEFVQRINAKTGKKYWLPSEAEWEYACRGVANQTYCGSDNVDAVAVYDKNSGKRTQPVMSKKPNGFGLYDMSGNVWEWTYDCWNVNYKNGPTNNYAVITGDCGLRVFRGGSWLNNATDTRSAFRVRYDSTLRNYNLGFRLARMLR